MTLLFLVMHVENLKCKSQSHFGNLKYSTYTTDICFHLLRAPLFYKPFLTRHSFN